MIAPPDITRDGSAPVDAAAAVGSFLGGKPRPPIILIYQPGLKARGIDFSRSHLWRLEAEGRFPKRVKIGNGRVAWIEHEVDAYLLGLAAERPSATITQKMASGKEDNQGKVLPVTQTSRTERPVVGTRSRRRPAPATMVEVSETCDAA